MKSNWPVLLAVLGVTIGAFIYDAHNADAAPRLDRRAPPGLVSEGRAARGGTSAGAWRPSATGRKRARRLSMPLRPRESSG